MQKENKKVQSTIGKKDPRGGHEGRRDPLVAADPWASPTEPMEESESAPSAPPVGAVPERPAPEPAGAPPVYATDGGSSSGGGPWQPRPELLDLLRSSGEALAANCAAQAHSQFAKMLVDYDQQMQRHLLDIRASVEGPAAEIKSSQEELSREHLETRRRLEELERRLNVSESAGSGSGVRAAADWNRPAREDLLRINADSAFDKETATASLQ